MKIRSLLLAALAAVFVSSPALAQDITRFIDANGKSVVVTPTNPLPTTGSGGGTAADPRVAQGSTTAGQTGTLTQGAVVTGDQTYTIGTTQPFNITPTGRLKVGLSSSSNIVPAANPSTTLTADLTACLYRAPVTWTAGFTGALQCDAGGNVTVVGKGGSTIVTGQVTVGTTATLIVAQRAGRQKVGVTVTTATQCAFGPVGVTLTTGWPLAAVAYVADSWDTSAALYGICAAAGTTVGYREQL